MQAKAVVVVGLGYGDEGKGTTVDWMVRRRASDLVVRFNGGAQAGHNVVTDDGRHHCFSQFGAGTFAGARTHLSRYVLVNPVTALSEATRLEALGVSRPFDRLTVEQEALVTTPLHVAANRLRELFREVRNSGRHGSCGMGIGETVQYHQDHGEDAVRVADLLDSDRLRLKLARMQERLVLGFCKEQPEAVMRAFSEGSGWMARREWDILRDPETITRTLGYFSRFLQGVTVVGRSWLDEELRRDATVVFEGAQGVLLDQDYGFHPHTTWSRCTEANASELLRGLDVEVLRLGLLRTFHTRHGAGPFPAAGDGEHRWTEGDHNVWTDWQQGFRVGAFDLVAARYALDVVGGVDGIGLTCVDRTPRGSTVCSEYDGRFDPELFVVGEFGWASRIRTKAGIDLERQERITRHLMSARPVVEREPVPPMNLANRLEVPLFMTSSGPRSSEKVWWRK